jgi:hypothetical protein
VEFTGEALPKENKFIRTGAGRPVQGSENPKTEENSVFNGLKKV